MSLKMITPIVIDDSNMDSSVAEPDASQAEKSWVSPLIGSPSFNFVDTEVFQTLMHSNGDSYLLGRTNSGDDHLFKISKDDQTVAIVGSYSGIYRTIAEGSDGNLYFAGNSSQFMKYTVSTGALSFFGTAGAYYYSSCTGPDGNIYLSGTEDLTTQFTKIDVSNLSVSQFGAAVHFIPDLVLHDDGFIYGISDKIDGEIKLIKVDTQAASYSIALKFSATSTRISSGGGHLLLAGSGAFVKINTSSYSLVSFGALKGFASKLINAGGNVFYCSADGYTKSDSIVFIDAENFNVINIEDDNNRSSITINSGYLYAFKSDSGESLKFSLVPEVDERFVDLSSHRIYSVVKSSVDSPMDGALLDIPSWVEVSATNKYRAFDYTLSSKSTMNASDAKISLHPNSPVTSLSAFGLEFVSSVTVKVYEVNEIGSLIYSKSKSLSISAPIEDLIVNDELLNSKVIFDDLPTYSSPYIVITFESSEDKINVGDIVIGNARTLGVSLYQSSTSRTSYNSVEYDTFGTPAIVKRPSAEYTSVEVAVFPEFADYVERILKDSLDEVRVWIAEKPNSEKLLTIGYYERSPITYSSPSKYDTTLKIRGLT